MAKQQQSRCLCGCGEQVSKGSSFRPGHDARAHSIYLGNTKGRLTPAGLAWARKRWGAKKQKAA